MDGALIGAAAAAVAIAMALGGLIWRLSATNATLEASVKRLHDDITEVKQLRVALTDVAVLRNDTIFLKESVAKLSSLFTQLRIQVERAEEREERTSQGDYR